MKKLIFLFVSLLSVQVAMADDALIASYSFPNQDLVSSGSYTGTISEILGIATGCSVYCYKIGGYATDGTTPNSKKWNNKTYYHKFSNAASYITITPSGGKRFQPKDFFRATLYNGSTPTDGFFFKSNPGNYKTINYNSTDSVVLEYQLKEADINADGSLTLYRYGAACFVNTITIERPVAYLSTNFNDGTWGTILAANPSSGTFGSSVRNSFKYTNAVMRNGDVSLSGPTALSDNDVKFTNRILVDKNTISYVITPYVNNCKTLRIVAQTGSDDKSFNVYKQIDEGEWTPVALSVSTNKTAQLYSYSIDSESPVRFRIENNTTSSLLLPFIGTDPLTFPVSISSLGYATFSSTGQYKVSDEDVKIYIINSNTSTSARLSEIDGNIIPAKTGVLLYKDGGGDIILESNSESATEVGTNLLKCNTVAQELSQTSGGNTNFILVPDGAGSVKFAKPNGTGSLAANKAYLQVPTDDLSGHELTISFADSETTGIGNLTPDLSQGEGVCFDLQGRKLSGKPTKGLYIVNGKKVIIK